MHSTPKQQQFIRRLVEERLTALSIESAERGIEAIAPDRLSKDQASKVIEQLLSLPTDPKPAVEGGAGSAEIEALRSVLDRLDARGREFASSLIAQFDRKGALSERQWPYVESLTQQATAGPVVEVEEGMYRHPDGRIVRVYRTRANRIACKVLVIEDGHGTLDYAGREPLRGLLDEHRLSQEEAAAFGRLHGFCIACARDLDDDRSIAAGYGPHCASAHGWHYPTKAEAAAILDRPTV